VATRIAQVALRFTKSLTQVRTGIILLIVLGIAAACGTLILQRPITDPETLAKTYAPETLAGLDRFGLTDIFHSWWFLALLTLLAINIVLASLERWPVAWRYFSRPYLKPERHFMSSLPMRAEIHIEDAGQGVAAARAAFRKLGMRPKQIGNGPEASLYAEKNRYARLAAYVVHASLLLILVGGIVDGVWSYRGFVALGLNESVKQIELRDGSKMDLPFTLRCDGAGQENYPDGSPRRWWSRLTVLENGKEVQRKEIEVNQPLVYAGLRFYQSSYGPSGEVGAVKVTARLKAASSASQNLTLALGDTQPLDSATTVNFARFLPDFVVRGREVELRSNELNNPAILLLVRTQGREPAKVWLFPKFPNFSHDSSSPYAFSFQDMEMGYYTGLQVSHEPGQWAVWVGCLLMAAGLLLAFYFTHLRVWAVPVNDGHGRLVLWVGASASKNRDELEEKFKALVNEIQNALQPQPAEPRRKTQLAHA